MLLMGMSKQKKLKEVAGLFFKLGLIAFGGPAAHIAMMEEEVVKKRKWMSEAHFLDLVGATNLIPGPNSTEMTMHCGYERAGWRGVFVAGFCFIFPAVVVTSIFALLYQKYGQLPAVEPFLYGIKPAVIAIILVAAYRLGKKAIKNVELGVLGAIGLVLCLLDFHEILVLFGCGIAGIFWYFVKRKSALITAVIPLLFYQVSASVNVGIPKIFLTFLKVGSILYGSGYVLFAFLDVELVNKGWLTRAELIDAVAVGQFTPGPVLSTATFIGWQMQGLSGALAATIGIFLPSFIFVLILNPFIPKMRKSPIIGAFLDAVNVAAVALILAVCLQMGFDSITDWKTTTILVVGLYSVFIHRKVNHAYIVLGGAVLGYLLSLF